MDDSRYGARNVSGDWIPSEPLKPAPLFVFPPQPRALLRWLPSYFFPWNALYFGLAVAFWLFLTPELATMENLNWDWMLFILLRNSLAVLVFYGLFEFRLYTQRAQETRFKYNPKFPSDRRRNGLIGGRQNIDNVVRTFTSGVPIWTAYEIVILHLFAKGYAPMASFASDPLWLAVIFVLARVFHEAHFYAVHRLIHYPFLYRHVHAVHHAATNPSPWSSLSMHPIEHLLYFSGSLIHLVIFSHPAMAMYQLHIAGYGAIGGHFGFEKVETGAERAFDTHSYDHYLHHKYFEVNYASGLVPFDRLFGTWHDGTPAGDAQMQARRKARQALR